MHRAPIILSRSIRTLLPAAALASLALLAAPAHAVDYVWSGPLGTAAVSWNDGANWTTSPVDDATFPNLAGDYANLTANFTGNTTVNLNAPITVGRLDFGDTSGSQTTALASGTGTGNTITFDSTAGNAILNLNAAGTGAQTIGVGLILNDNLDVTRAAHGVNFSGPINLNGNTLTFLGNGGSAGLVAIQGTAIVSGTGSLHMNAPGNANSNGSALNLQAPSTFSGGVTLSAGQIIVGVDSVMSGSTLVSGALGTGTLTINGGAIRNTGGTSRTMRNQVVVAGDFQIGQTDQTTSGLTMAGTMDLGSTTRTITIAGGGLGVGPLRHQITGVVSGNAGLILAAGSLQSNGLMLTADNTFTGDTLVRSSTLIVASTASLGTAVTPVVLGDANSGANNIGFALGSPASAATNLSFTRDVTVTNNGTGTVILGGVSDHNGAFTGAISLGRTSTLTSATTAGRATRLEGVVSGAGGLIKIGTGAARLSNADNTYTGSTIVRHGTLLVGGNAPTSGNSVLGNASSTIALGDSQSVAGDAPVLQIDGAFSIARDILVNPAITPTVAPTLTASNAAATTASYDGIVTLNKNVTLGNATAGATTLFSNNMTDGAGTASVNITGPGIVEFGGAGVNTYDGGTTVSSGTLRLNRNFGGNNTVTGALAINGGTLQLAGANQLPDTTVLTMNGGVFDVGGFAETITDLNYTGGAVINASQLFLTASTDRFLFDGQSISSPEVLNRALFYLGATDPGAVTADLALDADPVHDIAVNDGAAAVDLLISGVLSNQTTDTTITKKGPGVLKLTGNNTFGGVGQTVTVQAGTLEVTADNQLGNAANSVTLNGGALRIANSFETSRNLILGASGGILDITTGVSQTISGAGQISGSGPFTKTGLGELVISGDLSTSFSGVTAINAGTLSVSALNNILGNAANDLTLGGGTLKVTSSFALDAGKTITVGAAGGGLEVVTGQRFDLAQAGALAGAGPITKSGGGTLAIPQANTGIGAGSTLNIQAGTVELGNAQALGSTNKTAVTLSGGTLHAVNDIATTFGNPVVVTAPSSVSVDRATSGAGVTQTFGPLTLNGTKLTTSVGGNMTGTTGIAAFGAATLSGATEVEVSSGTTNFGALTAPAGVTFTKSGPGILALTANPATATSVDASTSVLVNGGLLQLKTSTPFGSNGATITANPGGTIGLEASVNGAKLIFAGGTMGSIGGERTWAGAPDTSPSITFTADTVFNVTDLLTPIASGGEPNRRSLDFGGADTGLMTSTGPVNLTVNADPGNGTAGANVRRIRFLYRDANGGTNQNGSVTGTLTVNNGAVAQLRSETLPGGSTSNPLGSGVEIRLNTGYNAGGVTSAGRLELLGNDNNNFGNNVVVLSDSTILVGLAGAGTGKTLSINNLSLGSTLGVDDVNSSSHTFQVAGTTTLTGNATLHANRPVILNNITDGDNAFGLTKIGTNTLALNGTGEINGAFANNLGTTTLNGTLNQVSAVNVGGGSLALGASDRVNDTAAVAVSAGSFALGVNSETVGSVALTGTGTVSNSAGSVLTTSSFSANSSSSSTINGVLAGSGGIFKAGTGGLTLGGVNTLAGDLDANGGTVNLSVSNALPSTMNADFSAGTLAMGATTQSIGTLNINGSANFTSTAGSQITTTGLTLNTTANLTINAVLAGSGGLTKSNTGTLSLAATNTFTGDAVFNAGTTTLNAVNALPGDAIINGGSLTLGVNDALSAATDVTVNSTIASPATFSGNSRSFTITNLTLNGYGQTSGPGFVSGSVGPTANFLGEVRLNADPAGGAIFTISSGGATAATMNINRLLVESGPTASSGALLIGSGSNSGTVNIGAGGLEMRNIASGSYSAIFQNSTPSTSPLVNLGGDVKFTAAAPDAATGVRLSGQTSTAANTIRLDLGAAPRTFNVENSAAESELFVSMRVTGAGGGIVKTGAGTLELAPSGSAHDYTGATTVDEGRLLVSGSLNGTSGVSVAAGATLGGTGSIVAPVTVSGTIAPGASPGTLSVQTLALNNGSTLALELNGLSPGDGAGFYDQLNVTSTGAGAVSLTGDVQISISLSGFAPTGSAVFYVLTRADSDVFSTLFAGTEGGFVNIDGGYSAQISYTANWTGDSGTSTITGGNDVAIYNVIPEPGTLVALAGGVAMLLGLRNRRRR